MRALLLLALMMLIMSAAYGQTPGPVRSLMVIGTTSPTAFETHMYDRWDRDRPGRPSGKRHSVAMHDGQIPAAVREFVASLGADELGMLYFYDETDELTLDRFPMAELADLVNGSERDLMVVLDLASHETEVTAARLAEWRRRMELFDRGMVIIACQPWRERKMREEDQVSVFTGCFFDAIRGHGDLDWNQRTTPWEAYVHAFWRAHLAVPGQNAWCRRAPFDERATLVEGWPSGEPDPLRIAWAEASFRRLDILGPVGQTGAPGPTHAAWMTWLHGPRPELNQESIEHWAWGNLEEAARRMEVLRTRCQALAALTRDALPPRFEPAFDMEGRWIVAVGKPHGRPGPPAMSPAPPSEAPTEQIAEIVPAEEREQAPANSEELASVAGSVEALWGRSEALEQKLVHYLAHIAESISMEYVTPRELPEETRAFVALGPAGSAGSIRRADEPQLAEPEASLASEEFAARLETISEQMRGSWALLREAEQRFESMTKSDEYRR